MVGTAPVRFPGEINVAPQEMTEEGKDVSFTTASGKAVSFKSKPRAKKEVVATPVETEPRQRSQLRKPSRHPGRWLTSRHPSPQRLG